MGRSSSAHHFRFPVVHVLPVRLVLSPACHERTVTAFGFTKPFCVMARTPAETVHLLWRTPAESPQTGRCLAKPLVLFEVKQRHWPPPASETVIERIDVKEGKVIFITTLPPKTKQTNKKESLFCGPTGLKRWVSYHTQLSRISVHRKPIQRLRSSFVVFCVKVLL